MEIHKLKLSSCKHEYSSVASGSGDTLGMLHYLHVLPALTNSSNPLKIQLQKFALKIGIWKGLFDTGLPDQDAALEL